MRKVKLELPKYKAMPGAKIVDFEFGDWRDFFVRPEDKFKVFKALKGYPFVVEINGSRSHYIIDHIPDNIAKLKILIPTSTRPPKQSWYYIDVEGTIYFYSVEKIEMAAFGYHVTVSNKRKF